MAEGARLQNADLKDLARRMADQQRQEIESLERQRMTHAHHGRNPARSA